MKDVTEWTPADVQDFLQSVLPGHACLSFFTYTSGYVLHSLEKDDLRRQARSDEAANIIWAELRKHRCATCGRIDFQVRTDRSGLEGPPCISVYVKLREEVAFEIDVLPTDTVDSLKERVAEHDGFPPACQRLIYNGMSLQDGRTLASYSVCHGATLLLVPTLKEQNQGKPVAFTAPRGALMIPGTKSWQPSNQHRPYVAVVCSDASRNFPMSLEFTSVSDSEAFARAAQEDALLLEIPPETPSGETTEVRVHLDVETGLARLDKTLRLLSPGMTYQGLVHFGGRGGHVKVALVTGAAVQ